MFQCFNHFKLSRSIIFFCFFFIFILCRLGPKTNVDTSPFRRAVWNYIQSIYGIRHDDYNYREVNILLERNLKSYIKYLGCFPENSMKRDFRSVMKGFRSSEKVSCFFVNFF